jgi:hypothetical protein
MVNEMKPTDSVAFTSFFGDFGTFGCAGLPSEPEKHLLRIPPSVNWLTLGSIKGRFF